MKKIVLTLAIGAFSLVSAQTKPAKPQIDKTEFSSEVLTQKLTSQKGNKTTIQEVLKKYEGKILIIDFWASWCRDCILALPKTQELKEKYPNVSFVYFSLDRSHSQWLRGLEKYKIDHEDNYWFDEGWKNKFNNFIELNWVPRFILVDQRGKIANYYAISPEDESLITAIQKLTQR